MKRIAVWFIETSSEALLLGLFLISLSGPDLHRFSFLRDLLIFSSAVCLLFFTTGYLLTTIVVRAVLRDRGWWMYPAIATALFFIHFEIANIVAGGAFEPPTRLRVRVAGACVVFACTVVGTLSLRRWTRDQPVTYETGNRGYHNLFGEAQGAETSLPLSFPRKDALA